MTKFIKVLGDILESVGVYVCTLAGIILSQYGSMLLQPAAIDIKLQGTRIAISCVMAFYVIISDERKGEPEGKRGAIKRRLSHAFTQGVTWNVVTGIGIQAIQAAGG